MLNANKNLEISKASMEVWKYGSVQKFFYKTHFINSSLKPFIHACFR